MIDTILTPLEYLVSAILLGVHRAFATVLPEDSGWTWGPAIVVLVLVIRTALIPLFVKQIKAQRGMQLLQPRMVEIRKKYAADRQRQSEEMMKLYKDSGTSPFSSCLPLLAQSPFFFGLYRVLEGIAHDKPRGLVTEADIALAQQAHIFGAPLPESFKDATSITTQIVIAVMIIAMCASQFITQRQIMLKNMPGGIDNPMAQQQKIMLYVFPLIFAVSGVFFPVGVLLYWLTTNIWTMGQQFYVIRKMPAPGSKAHEAMEARRAKKGGAATAATAPTTTIEAPPAAPPRQQPKRQTRDQRSRDQRTRDQRTKGSSSPAPGSRPDVGTSGTKTPGTPPPQPPST